MTGTDTLVSRFVAVARADPDRPAVSDGGFSVRYAELDGWSDTVCAELVRAGARPGDLVGISLRRGAPVVAAVLGVLKAGCGYVPLDPDYPVARLRFMIEDAGVAAVLVDDGTPAAVADGTTAVRMPGPEQRATAGRGGDASVPDGLAYVIYTSGSTGVPKGVPIRHRHVLALLDSARRHLPLGPDETWTLFHSYSFDFSVWEIWGALLFGGRLVCVSDLVRISGDAFHDLLVRERVTMVNIVPSVFRHLLVDNGRPAAELSVRRVVFGGEAVDPTSVSRWLARFAPARPPEMINMYGITESTVHVTYRRITGADLRRSGPGTVIGRPLAHLSVTLRDEHGRRVPPGERGEMYIAGTGVTDGYLRREELSAERFPLLDDGAGPVRYFRSGDLASWSDSDGGLVFHGRIDDQVQFLGFRVELGEIESALRAAPLVRDAAVVLDEEAGEPVLSAFVVPAPDATLAVRELRRTLLATLPRHMVPKRIRRIDALPRTSSGKTDRRALLARPDGHPSG
ncbi:amino acid adenylation domain-containing protein [Micromonospora cathayae]|uniref:Amino acid adenylation domain-containing protein n=1 Tax=Micromonospora cathayae TaxID=3028804 RepID=A0ABY7ZS68_9ACTN|nr:amino acid adenylation domain-containing protein [Micromonospora sp. HUAS 3]WDZ85832.1 amino acid adenylation domain-containing protein [Micromonospora sp. HUAS 3]